MSDKEKMISRELDKQEEERILEEVNRDPNVANRTAPKGMREEVFREIRAYETARVMVEREMFSEENKELIRLGKLYKKKRKRQKYYILAAVLVLAMSIGTTSMGGAEKLFKTFTMNLLGREQTQVDSEENVNSDMDMQEEQLIEEIEDKFGFYPVKLNYLPKGTCFLEGELDEIIPKIYMIYGNELGVKISYIIRPNYKESSWAKDIEDELIDEYEMNLEKTIMRVKKYLVEDETVRWAMQFSYKDINYSLYILDESKEEVEKIIENLYFF